MAYEQIICGFNAVMAAVRYRPDALERLFFIEALAPRLGKVCRTMAQDKKVYRVCPPEELEKLSHTNHHGGVVAFFKPRHPRKAQEDAVRRWQEEKALVLACDGVENPHNLGALARTAAFLGIRHLLLDEAAGRMILSTAALRTAEGGVEALELWVVPSLEAWLTTHRPSLSLVGTDMQGTVELGRLAQGRCEHREAMVLIMGNEEEGLSPAIRALCHQLVAIPGSGAVESLNVAQAAAICMYALADAPAPADRAMPPARKVPARTAAPRKAPAPAKVAYKKTPRPVGTTHVTSGGKKVVLVKKRPRPATED